MTYREGVYFNEMDDKDFFDDLEDEEEFKRKLLIKHELAQKGLLEGYSFDEFVKEKKAKYDL